MTVDRPPNPLSIFNFGLDRRLGNSIEIYHSIREMLKAVLPLEQLTKEQAVQLVIKHLVARASVTRCRLKKQQRGCQQGQAP